MFECCKCHQRIKRIEKQVAQVAQGVEQLLALEGSEIDPAVLAAQIVKMRATRQRVEAALANTTPPSL